VVDIISLRILLLFKSALVYASKMLQKEDTTQNTTIFHGQKKNTKLCLARRSQ